MVHLIFFRESVMFIIYFKYFFIIKGSIIDFIREIESQV